MKGKSKIGLLLSILLIIVSMVFIVVFEAGNKPVFNSDAEKVVLLDTEIESTYEYDSDQRRYVYNIRIDCKIENISTDYLLVKLYYTVSTSDGSETYEIDRAQSKVLEGETTYTAWVEFSHPTKNYSILEKVSASVNGGEVTPLRAKQEAPMTTGAMVSAVFFIAGIIGVGYFAKKSGKLVVGEIDEDDYEEMFGDGFDPDREQGENHEIKALKEEIEKEKLESTLTAMRSQKPKYCEYCGAKNKGDSTQCANCGARLK